MRRGCLHGEPDPYMSDSTSDFILRARQLDLQAMQHLGECAALVELIGQLVDALQRERGATSVYLASGGRRFEAERNAALAQAVPAEEALRAAFGVYLQSGHGHSAQVMATMGWVLLDLAGLGALRAAVAQQAPRVGDAVAAFSRVIAGLIELVFVLADGANDPAISRLLVTLVHLLQVKEAAGQERAVGAQLLASGVCTEVEQLRFIHLIDAQERAVDVLLDFIDAERRLHWDNAQGSPNMAQLERLRRGLCMAKVDQPLDAAQSQVWFEVSSKRIADLSRLEADLARDLKAQCERSIDRAQLELADSTGQVKRLRQNPSLHAQAVDRYFSEQGQPAAVPVLPLRAEAMPGGAPAPAASADTAIESAAEVASLHELLQRQTSKLAQTEQELRKARQALNERKTIERAKGALMNRLGLSEDAAYRALQKAAMDHNKRLLDVAEATLAISEIALGAAAPDVLPPGSPGAKTR
jgi:Nitrate and nitrite sensing/ANTAR domain